MRNIGRFSYMALAAALQHPLPRHRAVFQRASIRVRSLVYWRLDVQYRTHTTETFKYLGKYLAEFQATKDVFTTSRTSMATDSITHARTKDLMMQLMAEEAIEYEERAACREALSPAQKEH